MKKDGQKGGGKVDLNNLEGVGSMINNLMGGSGIEGLGNISKMVGLLGNSCGRGFPGFGGKYILILFIFLISIFGNRGNCQNTSNYPQYSCYCYKKGNHKDHKKNCCCCYCEPNNYCGYNTNSCNYGGNRGSFGGYGNIIFIILILLLVRGGRRACDIEEDASNDIFNFDARDVKTTEEEVEFVDAKEEE
ncbi:hypothetical protein Z959_09250 [Clostridium novyi B str. ATCC 27606]|uniref:Uncharacterized protein n=3 Tax=Clostridiaceae TaxID=31979 RepID=A0AA40IUU3_CLONO|nr:hypothetical protein Z958_11050 [Clostridium novyi B str. NCTC 9691]KEI16621.1 hypothetical protein Z959_09250 [Clostridium novyi B str. ATCC 27606]KEI18458.1 hypothetical protein Z960_02990 [Clostridium haemolyticum NCTC 9693]KGN04832.1 hypothetical protein Z961_00750 [Clostridium haemolyticum NCTC 8350]OOB76732.1 hypothetical protein AXF41_01940 [Clostridium haemolyticum]